MPFESDAVRKIFLQGMIKVLKSGTTDEYSRTLFLRLSQELADGFVDSLSGSPPIY